MWDRDRLRPGLQPEVQVERAVPGGMLAPNQVALQARSRHLIIADALDDARGLSDLGLEREQVLYLVRTQIRATVEDDDPARVGLEDVGGRAVHRGYADVVLVADIYAAGETPIECINRDALVAGLIEHGHRNARPLNEPTELAAIVRELTQPGDMVVCLGAGSITSWASSLPRDLAALQSASRVA